ncbi:MAG: type I-B CRISPR-associated protein Cas7/Csh2 [Thermodesulfobium narugense]|nr:MAG: type I-B CRISPR-associated protein Cas7/Csh2 [Thermodesulfobium narugense]
MANEILNKSDILFLYENIKANPNGDPDENKPRIDPVTRHCLVTDVRIKRTVRDYLNKTKGFSIFVERRGAGEAITASFRLQEEVDKVKKDLNKETKLTKDDLIKKLFSNHIDIRLFGCTITVQKNEKDYIKKVIEEEIDSITRPGPIQIILGESLHKVEIETIKGTTAFASTEKAGAGTFSTKYILPYALIAVSGVINPTSGKKTGLTQGDIDLFLEGLWFGTLNLNTGSKNQIPKLLIKVDYDSDKFNIGMLDYYLMGNLKLNDMVGKEEDIRSNKQFHLAIDDIVNALTKKKNQISKITIVDDGEITTKYKGQEKRFVDSLKEANIEDNQIKILDPNNLIKEEKK